MEIVVKASVSICAFTVIARAVDVLPVKVTASVASLKSCSLLASLLLFSPPSV